MSLRQAAPIPEGFRSIDELVPLVVEAVRDRHLGDVREKELLERPQQRPLMVRDLAVFLIAEALETGVLQAGFLEGRELQRVPGRDWLNLSVHSPTGPWTIVDVVEDKLHRTIITGALAGGFAGRYAEHVGRLVVVRDEAAEAFLASLGTNSPKPAATRAKTARDGRPPFRDEDLKIARRMYRMVLAGEADNPPDALHQIAKTTVLAGNKTQESRLKRVKTVYYEAFRNGELNDD